MRSKEPKRSFADHCTGVTWERDTIHNFLLRALVQKGDIRELKGRWSVFIRERKNAATCMPPPC